MAKVKINPFIKGKKANIFSILDPKNLKSQIRDSSSSIKTITGLKRNVTEDKMKDLPNQLKAILLYNVSNGSVNGDKFFDKDGISSIEAEPANNFNFEMLKKIERLSSFETNKEGEILIKSPQWKTLTKEDYDKFIGKEILCRLKSYENQDIGLKKSILLDVDSYDDYFILIPKELIEEDKPELVKNVGLKKRKIEVESNILTKALENNDHASNLDSMLMSANNISHKNVKTLIDSSQKDLPVILDRDIENIKKNSIFNKTK